MFANPCRAGVAWTVAASFALGACLFPPITQPPAYHDFADTRPLFGIANGLDVATNGAFLAIGLAGLALTLGRTGRAQFRDRRESWIYAVFFLGVAATSAGSAFYHLAPDNARLVWDRLPMTVAFMSLLAATVAERIDVRAGLRLLVPLLLIGIASVVYWRMTAICGTENVRPYLAVQYGAIAVILAVAALFRSAYTRSNDIYLVAALYVVAKVAELFDGAIFQGTAFISGHSLKHLIAAFAIYRIYRMLATRTLVTSFVPSGRASEAA